MIGLCVYHIDVRRLFVSAHGGREVDFGVRTRGLSPGRGHCVDALLSRCLSPPRCINGYQRISFWGVTLEWTSIHPGESRNSPSRFMLWKPG